MNFMVSIIAKIDIINKGCCIIKTDFNLRILQIIDLVICQVFAVLSKKRIIIIAINKSIYNTILIYSFTFRNTY